MLVMIASVTDLPVTRNELGWSVVDEVSDGRGPHGFGGSGGASRGLPHNPPYGPINHEKKPPATCQSRGSMPFFWYTRV